MSTYFIHKSVPKPDFGANAPTAGEAADLTVSDSQATLVNDPSPAESSSQLSVPSASTSALLLDAEVQPQTATSSPSGHLVAAFRGRTVRGQTVELPPGYAGIILNTPEAKQGGFTASTSKTAESAFHKPQSARRTTRGSKQMCEDGGADANEEPDLTELADALEASVPVRSLEVSASFSSFVLWNADIPVDEGRDEYLRSLTEWTNLAAVVSLGKKNLCRCPLIPLSSITDSQP